MSTTKHTDKEILLVGQSHLILGGVEGAHDKWHWLLTFGFLALAFGIWL